MNPTVMNELLNQYGELLRSVDSWFRDCAGCYPVQISCHDGCSACCRGLFDITLLDALYLKQGFDLLPVHVKASLMQRANERLQCLSLINPDFIYPWLLNAIDEDDWDALMPEDDLTPCLFLSATGNCLLYEYRPMTCRLTGIPLIDYSGTNFSDEWCTLNFIDNSVIYQADIRYDFNQLFKDELQLFQHLVRHLSGIVRNEVDMFIPAAITIEPDHIISALRALPVKVANRSL